jgi:S-layer homology domain
MKKQLVAAVLASLTLAVAAPALAAANPFVDVPAKHWAYDAVTKLAAAGIVDGYGDGTFRGDKTMTRYEMAQIVAKALAKSGNMSAADKAVVDKLVNEFNDELKSLGVRVAALEAATKPAVTWSGNVRFQSTQDVDSDSDKLENKLRLRLGAKAQVNDDTTVGFRLKVEDKMTKSSIPSTVEVTPPDKPFDKPIGTFEDNNFKAQLEHLYVATKLGGYNVTAGRYDYFLGQGGLNGDNYVTGLQVAKGKLNVVAGREWSKNEDFVGASYSGVPIGNTTWGVNFVDYPDLGNDTYVGGDVKFDLGKIGITAQYSTNTELDSDPEGYRVDAKLTKHFNVGYQNIELGAINDLGSTLDVVSNYKGWDATYTNAWAKNVDFEVKYWDMEAKTADAGDIDDPDDNTLKGDDNQTLRARLIFKF